MSDNYVEVTIAKLSQSEDAAYIAFQNDTVSWIPFSLMDYASEKRFKDADKATEVRVKIREWKLQKLGVL